MQLVQLEYIYGTLHKPLLKINDHVRDISNAKTSYPPNMFRSCTCTYSYNSVKLILLVCFMTRINILIIIQFVVQVFEKSL